MPTQNPIGSRLKAQMQHRDVSSAELAKRADVKTSFIYDVLSGKSANPSPVKLARLADALGVSLCALVGAENSREDAVADGYVAISYITASARTDSAPIIGENKTEPNYFREAWIREHLRAEPKDLRMMAVVGDSMAPTLLNGDMVLVNMAQKTATPAGIFVIFDGNGLSAKRLEYMANAKPPRLRIICDNPKYSAYERSPAEAYIIGRVVWFSRAM